MQWVVVISYRRFRTTYGSYLRGVDPPEDRTEFSAYVNVGLFLLNCFLKFLYCQFFIVSPCINDWQTHLFLIRGSHVWRLSKRTLLNIERTSHSSRRDQTFLRRATQRCGCYRRSNSRMLALCCHKQMERPTFLQKKNFFLHFTVSPWLLIH